MPKRISCCLCSKRVETNKPRVRIGSPSVWPLIEIHIEKMSLEITSFSTEANVCMKCYGMLSHYQMSDRGSNKVTKVSKPADTQLIITKNVLRSASRNNENVTDPAHQSSLRQPDTPTPVQSSEASTSSESLDGDTLPAQNESRVAVGSNRHSESDSAVHNSTPELTKNVCVDGLVVTTDESRSCLHRENESFEHNVDQEYDENVEDNSLYDPYPNTSKLEDQVHENLDDRSIVTSLHIEFLQNSENSSSSSSRDEIGDIIGEFEPDSLPSSLASGDNEETLTLTNADLIELNVQGVKSSESYCFVCKSKTGRSSIPWSAIQQVWFELRIYIPKSNRTCQDHIDETKRFKKEVLEIIEATERKITVRNDQFERWLHEISQLPQSRPCNLEIDGIVAEEYVMFFGIKKEFFDDLLEYLIGMRNTDARSRRSALGMFLMLLRNNMKQELISFHFSTTQQVVSQAIDSVSIALEQHFVPKYLGYHHITREEALQKHLLKLTSNVLNKAENSLGVIADCTYNYIEKPADYKLQRKTFSLHKKRNLLKPLYIVLPDGYILEATGPYFCDAKNNDAANIRHHYANSDLLLFLEEDDFFIFDRGYRDVVDETEAQGKTVFMPHLLTGKRTHFECSEANDSRKVTMNRWVVEAVNGRIKNVFPFFKHTIEGTYVPKIMRFNRIACAIMNKFFPPLTRNKEFHDIVSDVVQNHNVNTNDLKSEIERLGIQRMSARWQKASDTSIADFPELSMDDLQRITLGSYQLKMAEKYIQQHMKNDSEFDIYVHRQNDEIIRSKIQSRFSNSKTHNSWIKFDKSQNGHDSITGLYCTCKVGERTLGCCSHLAAVIRYLGYDRHQPVRVVSRSRSAWDAIDCAGENSESEAEE